MIKCSLHEIENLITSLKGIFENKNRQKTIKKKTQTKKTKQYKTKIKKKNKKKRKKMILKLESF